ncbi:MAG: EAL domain-containing protein, partial [Actinomycetota bacterium]|nr:EAL domain-containing protein [Actinomycetota bacterium]
YAGFGTAALLLVLTMLLVVEFFLRRSSRLQELVTQNRHWALHDELTGLPNRVLFRDRALQALGQARRSSSGVAMMIMDLDRFKEVNDSLGHHHGDLLLKEVSQRLTSALREVDTVARFGGDEFAVLLTDVAEDAAIHKVVAKILEAVRLPLVLDGFTISIDASIGIAVSPRHGDDFETLMKRADVAMYQAKALGGGFEIYTARRDQNSPGKLTLTHDLRSAIDQGQLLLHYQPQLNLPGRGVEMVEALVRWQHPARGLLSPQEFIPLAERSGLIRDLSRWVLENALRQNGIWRSQGVDVGVAVNVSARDLVDPSFAEEIRLLLRRFSVPPEALELEITESALMADPERAVTILSQLRSLGVRLAVDDFGTGYSSLAYLQRLPVTGVKIDKSFVKGLRRGDAGFVIVRSTIEIARVLGLRTVAEGVEDEALWDTLAALGCDAAQGHWVGHPIVGEQIPWLLSVLRAPAPGVDELEQLLLGSD